MSSCFPELTPKLDNLVCFLSVGHKMTLGELKYYDNIAPTILNVHLNMKPIVAS